MIKIGSYNRLTIERHSDHGLYLTDGEEDVLLPRKYVPEGMALGDALRVFVSTDSEDRPIATTLRPKGVVGDFVTLWANDIASMGAFMDWGLEKDLFIPVSEQHRRIERGKPYLVMIRLDEETQRVYGSTKLAKYLQGDPGDLEVGGEVSAMVADVVKDGARVVVDGHYLGTVFRDEIFGHLRIGEVRRAWVKRLREDGGVAISFSPQGQKGVEEQGPEILARLKRAGGFLDIGDFSSPEEIRREFGISKGTFKKAIGGLMKSGWIEITPYGIRLRE